MVARLGHHYCNFFLMPLMWVSVLLLLRSFCFCFHFLLLLKFLGLCCLPGDSHTEREGLSLCELTDSQGHGLNKLLSQLPACCLRQCDSEMCLHWSCGIYLGLLLLVPQNQSVFSPGLEGITVIMLFLK